MLFLTTNRPGQIDDAFISRIQVPIRFKPLSGSYLLQIWENFFDKLKDDQAEVERQNLNRSPEDKVPIITIDPAAKKWIRRRFGSPDSPQLNGRDIRNALQTAITLAEYKFYEKKVTDGIVVTEEHFANVLKMSIDFRKHVSEIARGMDEEGRAYARKERKDTPSKKPRDDSNKE
jgi:ATP-dependent Clp protease ATP-binding subunit ClpA